MEQTQNSQRVKFVTITFLYSCRYAMDNSWTPTHRKIKYQSSASELANRIAIIVQLDDPIFLSKKNLKHVAFFISAGKHLNLAEVTGCLTHKRRGARSVLAEAARTLRSAIKFVFLQSQVGMRRNKKSALIQTFALTKVTICVFLLMDFLFQEMNSI